MLKLFRNNMVLQVLLIIAALVVLWLRQLMTPPTMVASPTDGVLYTLLLSALSTASRAAVIIAMILILAEGVLLNLLLSNMGLVPQTSLLPTLLFIVFMSAPATTLTPMILVTGALIACVHQLMLRGTLLAISTEHICSATALIGLCSMFYVPALAILVSYLLVAVSFRLYSWREVAALFLGIMAPYILLITILYLTGNLITWWDITTANFGQFGIQIAHMDTLTLIANIVLILVFAASIFILWGHLGEHPVVWQKNASTVMLVSVGSLVMLFLSTLLPANPAFFAVPFALCGTHMLMPANTYHTRGRSKQRLWIYDLLFIITFAAALVC